MWISLYPLRAEGRHVNHKRVWQLYSEAKLAVRRRKKTKRSISERTTLSSVAHELSVEYGLCDG